jgi:hypothetical protein
MADAVGTGNTAPALTTVTVLVLLWGLIAYAVRLTVKLRKSDSWGADDIAITVAAVSFDVHRLISISAGSNRIHRRP